MPRRGPLCFRASEELEDRLSHACEVLEVSRAALLAEALEHYLVALEEGATTGVDQMCLAPAPDTTRGRMAQV